MEWRQMSLGEVADKMLILKIKTEKFTKGSYKHDMATKQHEFIGENFKEFCRNEISLEGHHVLKVLLEKLYLVNKRLWDSEDKVCASTDIQEVANTAKWSRKLNIERADIKQQIDCIIGETFLEMKEYADTKDLL